jgi:hypothetical protein
VIQSAYADPTSKELWISLEMDETLSAGARKMGYLLHPALIDGGLQAFIVWLLKCPDFSGIPQGIEHFHMVRPPPSNRLICLFTPPSYWGSKHRLGQFTFDDGEAPCGDISLYDATSGELVAYLTGYHGFHSNPVRPELDRSQFCAIWQPLALPLSPADLSSYLSTSVMESSSLAEQLLDLLTKVEEEEVSLEAKRDEAADLAAKIMEFVLERNEQGFPGIEGEGAVGETRVMRFMEMYCEGKEGKDSTKDSKVPTKDGKDQTKDSKDSTTDGKGPTKDASLLMTHPKVLKALQKFGFGEQRCDEYIVTAEAQVHNIHIDRIL